MLTNRWHILALLFVARTTFGFQFQTVASTAPFLRKQYAIGLVEIGTLIGLHMLPGGLLIRRFGDKTLCLASLFLMVVGGAMMGISDTYAGALVGRLFSGCGAVLLSVVLTKMTTDWFAGLEIVTAMSILLTSWPLGIALALVFQPPLATALGWPWVMHTAAAVCGFALLLIAVFYQSPPISATPPSSARCLIALYSFENLGRQQSLPSTFRKPQIKAKPKNGLRSYTAEVAISIAQHSLHDLL
jgi:MFS family permease